jgi:membrane protein YqaA with SNARE-associated domain
MLYYTAKRFQTIQILCTTIAAVVSPVLLYLLGYFFKERSERRRQAEELRRFKMLSLKCVITNKELSCQARLDAYDEYKKEGGNSWIDAYVVKHLKNIEE